MTTALEWAGSLLGLLGAYLLASHSAVARWGWVAFLLANVATGAFAIAIGAHGLLIGVVVSSSQIDTLAAKNARRDRHLRFLPLAAAGAFSAD